MKTFYCRLAEPGDIASPPHFVDDVAHIVFADTPDEAQRKCPPPLSYQWWVVEETKVHGGIPVSVHRTRERDAWRRKVIISVAGRERVRVEWVNGRPHMQWNTNNE